MDYISITPVLPRDIDCTTGRAEVTDLTDEALDVLENEKMKRDIAQLTFLDSYQTIGVDQSRIAPTRQRTDLHDPASETGVDAEESFESVIPADSFDDSMNVVG